MKILKPGETQITYIYTLIDPRDGMVKYVGKSDNPNNRLKQHIRKASYSSTIKNNWVLSLLNNGLEPIIDILDVVPNNEWSFWEIYWISQLKCWGYDLKNSTIGGDGGNFGEYINKKISESKKGFKHSEVTKKKMSKSAKIRKISDEGRKKLSESRLGSLNVMYGKKQSKHCIESKYKSIIQLDLYGNFIKIWPSFKSVTESLNINRNNIRTVCNGKRITAGGYKWMWTNGNTEYK